MLRRLAQVVLWLTYRFGQRAALPWRAPMEVHGEEGWPEPLVEGDWYWTQLGLTRLRYELGPKGWYEAERIETPRTSLGRSGKWVPDDWLIPEAGVTAGELRRSSQGLLSDG